MRKQENSFLLMSFLQQNILSALFLILLVSTSVDAQLYSAADFDKDYDMVLKNPGVQIEATEAVNLLYNYKFDEADKEFRWLKLRYPAHPMPHFLMALAEWWKIVPNPDNTTYDDRFEMHLDSSIALAERLYAIKENKVEPSFFLAAAWAFKGRLYAERKKWTKATFAGKKALRYLDESKGKGDLTPELLFGDGLYNYYAEWIPKEYPLLKSILVFFPKGNKKLGQEQLEEVANYAFYTRVEARYFLLQIYSMEKQYDKAYELAKYMWQTFPDNPYFERYLCRTAYVTGRMNEAQKTAENILDRINRGMPGYEGVSGRTAAYVLGYYYQNYFRDYAKAKDYHQQVLAFSEKTNDTKTGYYLSSLLALGKIAQLEKNVQEAQRYYKMVLDKAERKSSYTKEAKSAMDSMKKSKRESRKAGRK